MDRRPHAKGPQQAPRVFGQRVLDRLGKGREIIVRIIVDEENLVENAAKVGAYFVGELQRFGTTFPKLVSNVRGRGLMAALDLPDTQLRDAAIKTLMQHDMMVLASGHRSLRFRPALNLSIEEAAEGIRRMEKALGHLA